MKINKNNIFAFLICLIWTQSILVQYVRAIIMRLPIVGAFPDAVIAATYVVVIVLSLSVFKEITLWDALFLSCVEIFFFLNWAFNQDVEEYIGRYMVDFLVLRLPLYIVGVNFAQSKDRDKVIRVMCILSIITLFSDILYRFTIGTAMDEVQSLYQGDLDKAYKLLPHCCLIAYYAIHKTDWFKIVCMVVGGLYLLMLGTRGAALIYLAFIAVQFIIGSHSKWMIARVVLISGAIGAFLSGPLYEASLLWMYQRARVFGLSVRVFDKLLAGNISDESGRDIIRQTLLEAIGRKPFLGYGLLGDRIVLNGGFSHNIAFEFWVDFGFIIGTVLLISMIAICFRGYVCSEWAAKGLIVALFFSAFLMMFFSGSIFDEFFPLFLLGFCVGQIRQNHSYYSNMPRSY